MAREHDDNQDAWMATARDQELRLILDEERAERRLARSRSRLEQAHRRLERAERRVNRRSRLMKEAEAELAKCQERRALGPAPAAPETVIHDRAGSAQDGQEPLSAEREECTGTSDT